MSFNRCAHSRLDGCLVIFIVMWPSNNLTLISRKVIKLIPWQTRQTAKSEILCFYAEDVVLKKSRRIVEMALLLFTSAPWTDLWKVVLLFFGKKCHVIVRNIHSWRVSWPCMVWCGSSGLFVRHDTPSKLNTDLWWLCWVTQHHTDNGSTVHVWREAR